MARSTWGSIRTRGKNYHEIRYTVDGEQCSEYFHGTKKEAERRKAELRLEYEDCAGARLKVDAFWRKTYWPECRSLAPTTRDEYERVYLRDIKPRWGKLAMRSIAASDVQEWLSGMTYGKARAARAVMRAMFNRAEDLERIDRNVMRRKYKMPKERAPGGRSDAVFTAEELDQVFEACRGELWEPAFILAGFASAAREEAMSPLLEEFEFPVIDGEEYAVVPVRRGVQRLKGEVVVLEYTKTEDRERSLVTWPPYSTRLHEIVDERIEAGDTWLMDDGFGWPMCPNNMATAYKRWFLGKPFGYAPFSNLRNGFATMMHAKGIDMYMVEKMMGHSQPMTTYRHYDRPGVEEFVQVIRRANAGDANKG